MAGISSKALKSASYPENKKGYNGNELQSEEFADGNGLELYDFNARTYDPQLGRFIQIDPWVELGSQEMLTPYQFSYNNPIRYNDPDGKCLFCPFIIPALPAIGEGLVALGAATGLTVVAVQAINKIKDADFSDVPIGNSSMTLIPETMHPGALNNTIPADNAPVGTGTLPYPIAGRLDGNGAANSASQSGRVNIGEYQSSGDLPRNPTTKEPTPDPAATGPHSQLGSKEGSKGTYNQAREFDQNGKPVKDIDFTDHGRPNQHTNPHEHPYVENPTGGTPQRGNPQPLNVDLNRYLPWMQQKH